MSRVHLVAGNWKMNSDQASIDPLLTSIKKNTDASVAAELIVFPPYPYLAQCQALLAGTSVKWGAQNMCEQSDGAYTGEVSASMLQDMGCEYVILGHSERRMYCHETNEIVFKKFKKALEAGLKPILCVGETLEQRDQGKTLEIVQEQLAHMVTLQDNLTALATVVIAYEPVWAIGSGQSATPEQAQQVHNAIREQLAGIDTNLAANMRILYGGSVKPDNAANLFAMPDIDGALVGGASLDAEQFIAIGNACNQLS
jgi:triosephosphate isomerase (TIM)